MLRPAALLLAVVFASPALYAGLVTGALDLDAALVRFLVAVPVCAVALAVLRELIGTFAAPEGEIVETPARRRTDVGSGTTSS